MRPNPLRAILLLALPLLPGLATAQSLTRDVPTPAPRPPAVAAGEERRPVPDQSRSRPGRDPRDAWPNLDPFLPHPDGTDGRILTPARTGG